jgi:hypothetical protein
MVVDENYRFTLAPAVQLTSLSITKVVNVAMWGHNDFRVPTVLYQNPKCRVQFPTGQLDSYYFSSLNSTDLNL